MTLTVSLGSAPTGRTPLLRSQDDELLRVPLARSGPEPTGHPAMCVRLGGELDLRGLPLLQAGLSGLRQHAPTPSLTVDLRDLLFVDLHGLRGLLSACAQERDLGTHVCVMGANGQVLRMLQLAVARGWLLDLPSARLLDKRCPDHAGSLLRRGR